MNYAPHATCYLWDPWLIAVMNGTDAVIALAYYSIPVALMMAVKKRRARGLVVWPLWAFSAFIILCGTTHVMDIVTVWNPIYWWDAAVNAACALVSIGTALLLLPGKRYREVLEAIALFEERLQRSEELMKRLGIPDAHKRRG